MSVTIGELELPAIESKGGGDIGVLLAHGAGAGQAHPFMEMVRAGLTAAGIPYLAFDYPYIAAGRKRPDAPARLLAAHADAFDHLARSVERIVVAGKSMGGRIGSHLVSGTVPRGSWDGPPRPAAGLAYLGYPFVAPGRREVRDTSHLQAIDVSQLFVQGTRDALAPLDLVSPVVQSLPKAELTVIEGGDHSFRVRKMDDLEQHEADAMVVGALVGFVQRLRTGGGT